MAEPLDVDEMRQTLARVSVYRKVCDTVRGGAGHTIFNGVFFLGIAALYYNLFNGFHPLLLGPLIIGCCEVLVGIWKRLRPSPECVLLDAILQAGFVASIVIREVLWLQQFPGRKPSTFTIVFGLWWAYDAVNTFRYYLALRKAFVERPTAEHLDYVDDLTAEIAHGDAHTDPTVIDLPTKPHLKAKLLGDVAFFYDFRERELFLCGRDEVALARHVRDGEPEATLTILQHRYPPFALDATSWNNYAAWKAAGGEPPPPPTALPARDEFPA